MNREEKEKLYILLKEKHKRKARENFIDFVTYIMPTYEINWHHREIAETLQRMAEGKTSRPNLLMTLPPRAGKSLLASRLFPCWFLGKYPDKAIIIASYALRLSQSFGRWNRNLINSSLYKEVFPDTIISKDSQSREEFNTTRGGLFKATAVDGSITGYDSDVIIVDDITKGRNEAYSEIKRNNGWEWFTTDLLSRETIREVGQRNPLIVLGTMFHSDDPLSRIQQLEEFEEDWNFLKFPAINEDGTPLWARYGLKYLERRKRLMTSALFQALYMCNPQKEGGNYFRENWLIYFEAEDLPLKEQLKFYITLDSAFSEDENDYTAILVWCVDAFGFIYLINIYREQVTNLTWTSKLVEFVKMYKPTYVFTERGKDFRASAPLIRQRMRETGTHFRLIDVPITSSKEARASSSQALIENGFMFFNNKIKGWQEFKEEMLLFPNGAHDDQVDSMSLIGLFVNGLIKGTPPPLPPESRGLLNREDFFDKPPPMNA